MTEESKIIPFPGTKKQPEDETSFDRLFELDENEFPALSTAELRSLLTDIEAAYALYGDDSGTEPESGEWSEREEKMETLDDLSDAVWDVLDSRGE